SEAPACMPYLMTPTGPCPGWNAVSASPRRLSPRRAVVRLGLTTPQHVNAPLAVAAAVERDPPAIRRPGELLRCRIREHVLHRAIGKVEQPGAVAEDLEDDLRAIRRNRGRPHELPLHRRLIARG